MEWRKIVRPRTLFAIATVLGCSSTLQAWRLAVVSEKTVRTVNVIRLAVTNLSYWYVPALAALPILAYASRLQRNSHRLPALIGLHVLGALAYSVAHTTLMTIVHILPFERPLTMEWLVINWQRLYFTQLDWMLMTYGTLVGVAYAVTYRRDAERRAVAEAGLRVALVEAQLQALRHQLQPHFLFNTLNTVAALMRTDIAAAEHVLEQLGDLLRMTLHADGRQEVPLRDEIAILEKYLQIEQARFRDRLTVSISTTPEAANAMVPSLLLQPIVENAIRHGIAPHGRPGRVDVAATRSGDRLAIDVRDTGGGVPESPVPSGVGLTNTRARLERLYGSAQSLVLANRQQGGCAVTITLPFKTDAIETHPA